MIRPRFIFLGTGTSAGVPAIGCDCATCRSDDPRDRRLRTGGAVCWTDAAGHDRTVLIDATPDLRQQALAHGLRRCDAVLFTHNHVHHMWGLDEVRRYNAVMRAPIDVYAEPRTLEALRRVYQHVFEKEDNVNDSFVASLIPFEARVQEPIDLWGLRFEPLRHLHGRLPILGFRIEPSPPLPLGEVGQAQPDRVRACDQQRATDPTLSPTPPSGAGVQTAHSSASSAHGAPDHGSPAFLPLAWCTDVSAIPPETYPRLTGLSTLVLDCLRLRHHPTHLNLDQALHVEAEIGARRTWFVHMAHDLAHAPTDALLPDDSVRLAWDGLTLE